MRSLKLHVAMIVSCLCMAIHVQAQTSGCTDPAANNYNASATVNDGSCTYNSATLTPDLKANLVSDLQENSGIVYWNNRLWTHNDGGNTNEVIEMDTTGAIIRKITVSNATNVDWEDIAQDNTYLYVGDFGNNASGNRQDLKIYRILKSDILSGNSVTADVISYAYADQTDFTAVAANTTNFDCEAMIVLNGKIYLFMKQWTALGTSVYELPATPGTVTATRISTSALPSNWLVTGADIVPEQRTIALCGYNASNGSRYLYLLYDYTGTDFLSGNERIVNLTGVGQTEGLAFKDAEYLFISRERLTVSIFVFPQALEAVNLTTLLRPYLLQLVPISSLSFSVAPYNLGNRITWDIIPKEELAEGWLQRKDAASDRYQDIHHFFQSSGWHEDASPGNRPYYRIRALDRQGKESYSREYRAAQTWKTEGIRKEGQTLRASSPGLMLSVYGMNGNLILQARGSLDISTLPSGTYMAICTDEMGDVMARSSFIR
jgi:hypothetical protein